MQYENEKLNINSEIPTCILVVGVCANTRRSGYAQLVLHFIVPVNAVCLMYPCSWACIRQYAKVGLRPTSSTLHSSCKRRLFNLITCTHQYTLVVITIFSTCSFSLVGRSPTFAEGCIRICIHLIAYLGCMWIIAHAH